MRNRKKLLTMLVLAMVLSILPAMPASAKVKLSATSKTLEIGKTATIKISGAKKGAKWSVSNSHIKITKKTKKNATIKAMSEGISYLKAKVGKKTYTCSVYVKKKEEKPESTPKPTEKPEEVIKIGKLLCEDENISVEFNEIRNGKIYLLYKNNSDEDIRVDVQYFELNGKGYYQEIEGKVVISGKEREVELKLYDSELEEINYDFRGGVICAQFEYFSMDEEIKYNGSIKTDNIDINS